MARFPLLVAIAVGVLSLWQTDDALAAHPCNPTSLDDGSVVRVATLRASCRSGRQVAREFFGRIQEGSRFDGRTAQGSIYYSVAGFRCSPGLGGSQTFCRSKGHRWVFASVRPDDHPAGWAPLTRRAPRVKTVVLCPDDLGDTVDYVKPDSCTFHNAAFSGDQSLPDHVATASSADAIYVTAMHWTRWGGNVARAVGTFAGNMDYRAHASVRLSHPTRCSGLPERVYSEFWIRIGSDDPVRYQLDSCA